MREMRKRLGEQQHSHAEHKHDHAKGHDHTKGQDHARRATIKKGEKECCGKCGCKGKQEDAVQACEGCARRPRTASARAARRSAAACAKKDCPADAKKGCEGCKKAEGGKCEGCAKKAAACKKECPAAKGDAAKKGCEGCKKAEGGKCEGCAKKAAACKKECPAAKGDAAKKGCEGCKKAEGGKCEGCAKKAAACEKKECPAAKGDTAKKGCEGCKKAEGGKCEGCAKKGAACDQKPRVRQRQVASVPPAVAGTKDGCKCEAPARRANLRRDRDRPLADRGHDAVARQSRWAPHTARRHVSPRGTTAAPGSVRALVRGRCTCASPLHHLRASRS